MAPAEQDRTDGSPEPLAKSGVLVAPPLGLKRRVAFRVGLVAMARSEHRRARYLSALGLVLALALAAGVPMVGGPGTFGDSWVARNFPGCMGYLDYLAGQSGDTLGAVVFVCVLAFGGLWTLVQRRAKPL